MQIELSVKERFALLELLPQSGSIADMRVLRDLKGIVAISPEEYEEFGIEQNGNHVKWDEKKERPLVMTMNRAFLKTIESAIKKADKESRIYDRHLSIIEKLEKEGEL